MAELKVMVKNIKRLVITQVQKRIEAVKEIEKNKESQNKVVSKQEKKTTEIH